MTTEVAVMNRMAVALAADSAVTVEVGDTTKIRDSALKLFAPSKFRPVGVMVYNNPSILGVPLETIIKMFRRELGREAFDTLPEYGEALISYLDGNTSLFPDDVQERYFLRAVETEFGRIRNMAKKELVESGLYDDEKVEPGEAVARCARIAIKARLAFWRNKEEAANFSKVAAVDMLNRNSGTINDLTRNEFVDWQVDHRGVRRLYEIAKHLILKDYFPDDVLSGLVIAGFGEREHFPSVQHFEIGGVYGNKLKVGPSSVEQVSEDSPSTIKAFGYKRMVDAFLFGISPSVRPHLQAATAIIEELPSLALNAVTGLTAENKRKLAENIRQASANRASEFAGNVVRGSIARWQDIASAVESL